jgi:hypothetical protein
VVHTLASATRTDRLRHHGAVHLRRLACALAVVAGCTNGGGDATSSTARATATPASTTTTAPVDAPDDVVPPRDAQHAAERITEIERAIRDPATPSRELPALGWEQQVIYRALTGDDAWFGEVRRSVPADVAEIVEANVGGNASVGSLVEPPDTLPADWRIVTPPPQAELLGYYREAEAASGIPWPYLAAIHLVETRMGRIVGESSAGAQGPMQFLPSTWEAYGAGGDISDPRDAILAAGRYLAASGGPADMRAALFAYNRADAYVDAVSRYASVMAADERAYLGYYQWQVSYRTTGGVYLLPEGYPDEPAVPIG